MTKALEDFVLTREELPILLNVLYANNNWRLYIHPFLIKKNIFSIELGDTVIVKQLVDRKQYKELLEHMAKITVGLLVKMDAHYKEKYEGEKNE